jgi:phage-related baseplate assembly protein
MRRFSSVDLALLPEPNVIEPLVYENIRSELIAAFVARYPEYDMTNTEGDPILKVLEVCAERVLIERARVNSAARSVMLPYALRSDLDALGALFQVARPDIVAANPLKGTPAVKMDDGPYRDLIQLSIQAYSSAGPYGAYAFFALQADSNVADVNVVGPESGLVGPGEVGIYVLSTEGDGTPTTQTVNAVINATTDPQRRPLTDHVLVRAAHITPYTISVTLYAKSGPDMNLLATTAKAAITAYASARRKVGNKIHRSGIAGAAFIPSIVSGGIEFKNPVEDVIVTTPATDIDPGQDGCGYTDPTTIVVTTQLAS